MKNIFFLTFFAILASCAPNQTVIPRASIVGENKPRVEIVEKQIKQVTASAEKTVDLAQKVSVKYSEDTDVQETVKSAKETAEKSRESEVMISSLKARVEISDAEIKEADKQITILAKESIDNKVSINKLSGQITEQKATIWKQRKWMAIVSCCLALVLVLWTKPWRLFI